MHSVIGFVSFVTIIVNIMPNVRDHIVQYHIGTMCCVVSDL